MKVCVPLAEGFEEIEAVSIIDVLRRAGIDVVTAYLAKNPVTGSHQIIISADRNFMDLDPVNFDAIVLPGGPGTKLLKENSAVIDFIKSVYSKNKHVAAVCAAPTVLARAGIMNGKKSTCFPGCETEMGNAVLTGKPFEIDGKIITGKGAGAALDFSLAVVSELVGTEIAAKVRSAMQVFWNI